VVECLIGFVAETSLQSIKRATDDTIAEWYFNVSPPPSRTLYQTYHYTDAPSLAALPNLRQKQPLRMGSIAPAQTPPKARQPDPVPTRLARRDARRAPAPSHRPAAAEEDGVRGAQRGRGRAGTPCAKESSAAGQGCA
jgi:hypothetical protein